MANKIQTQASKAASPHPHTPTPFTSELVAKLAETQITRGFSYECVPKGVLICQPKHMMTHFLWYIDPRSPHLLKTATVELQSPAGSSAVKRWNPILLQKKQMHKQLGNMLQKYAARDICRRYCLFVNLGLKAGNQNPPPHPAGEWLRYETISRWSLATV